MVMETPGVGGGGEGGLILPYISDVGMCGPKREEFLHRFDRNLGLDFAHFGLKSWFSRELPLSTVNSIACKHF